MLSAKWRQFGLGLNPGHRWIPRTKAVTQKFNVFFDLHGWANNCEAGDLRRHRAHFDVIMTYRKFVTLQQHGSLLHPLS